MLEIRCPSCQAALGIEQRHSGGAVQCSECGERILLATPIVTPSVPVAGIHQAKQASASGDAGPRIRTGASRVRRRKKPTLASYVSSFISLFIHCSIFAATVAGGYYIWQRVEQRKQDEQLAAERQALTSSQQQLHRPARRPVRPETSQPSTLARPREVVPEIPRPPAAPANPFSRFSKTLTLPPTEDKAIVKLLSNVQDCELLFVTSDESLVHKVNKLFWQEDEKPLVVAGLTIRNGTLLFRWIGDVPDDAQKAVVNSLVKIQSQGQTYTAPLRTPKLVKPFLFDLTDSVHSVKCDCPLSPEPKQVLVSISTDPSYPNHRLEGCDLECLKWQDSATLFYANANHAATKISLGRKGNLAVLTLNSRYTLPSGDSEPMSIGQGNRKLKELNNLISQAQQASEGLPQLSSRLYSLQSDLQQAQNINTWNTINGVRLQNPILAGKKSMLISGLTGQIVAVRKRITLANQLISNRSAMERELSELKRVAALAQQLHLKAQLTYRFYHVVGDTEVDLVIAK